MSFNYAEMTTAELIDLLFTEEDRVTRQHIEEVVRRGGEAKPRLLEILANDDYWYEGQHAEFWIVVHVTTILGLMRDPGLLPDLLARVMDSFFADQEWVQERWPEILALFGEAAVEPLTGFIRDHRGAHRDNSDYSFARIKVAMALARIGLEHEAVRQRIFDFFSELLTDPAEDDTTFLSFIVSHPVALDPQHGPDVVRAAYKRGVIDQGINGTQSQLLKHLSDLKSNPFWELHRDLFDFYEPKAISARQDRWSREAAEEREEREHNRAWSGPPPFPLPFDRLYSDTRVSIPAGYVETEAGNIIRTEKIGRNDPCPCGSGKKYKKCCGKE